MINSGKIHKAFEFFKKNFNSSKLKPQSFFINSGKKTKYFLGNMLERYKASMVLHAVGDSIGYHGARWEFCKSGRVIYEELVEYGGIDSLVLEPNNWPVSDDTVLHLAVAECLTENNDLPPGPELYCKLVEYYKEGMKDMTGRAPGRTTIDSVSKLSSKNKNGYRIPFNAFGGGCGASMRSSCIGLRYPKPEQLDNLIKFSIESGRMTHHAPIGYLGGFVAALFTSYAIQNRKLENWGVDMLNELPKALNYIMEDGYHVQENVDHWQVFIDDWTSYLEIRNISKPDQEATFPANYDIEEREKFYKKVAKNRWPGAVGVDSVIIAYDALLGCKTDWKELCLRAAIHGGDSDSTACIAGSWFGALYGFKGVSKNNYTTLEYLDRLLKCAGNLYKISGIDAN